MLPLPRTQTHKHFSESAHTKLTCCDFWETTIIHLLMLDLIVRRNHRGQPPNQWEHSYNISHLVSMKTVKIVWGKKWFLRVLANVWILAPTDATKDFSANCWHQTNYSCRHTVSYYAIHVGVPQNIFDTCLACMRMNGVTVKVWDCSKTECLFCFDVTSLYFFLYNYRFIILGWKCNAL